MSIYGKFIKWLATWAFVPALCAGAGKVTVDVHAAGYERYDKPVEVRMDRGPIQVVEVDAGGHVVSNSVPFQFDKGTLVFLLTGTTAKDATRRFEIREAKTTANVRPLVTLTDDVEWEGQASYKIATQNATYLYHKDGAGFASMIDKDGRDWIGFHPYGGPDGKYRGIPNLVHPEGHFHPGNTGCTSRITSSGPLKITIESESKDGKWEVRWDIFSRYARLTVLKAEKPYWFLYEGSLAGRFEPEQQYVVRSGGQRTPATERWDGDIPDPEWLYFGDARIPQVLYIVHHEDDAAVDSYWPMQGQMTVFGFGRLKLEQFMESVPNHFTIGFAEDAEDAGKVIDSAFRELRVSVSATE